MGRGTVRIDYGAAELHSPAAIASAMKETLDQDNSRLLLNFPSREALNHFLERSRGYGDMSIKLLERLDPKREMQVVLTQGESALEFPTRVKQVYRSGADRWGTVLTVLDWSAAETPVVETKSSELAKVAPAPAGTGETTGTSVVFEIRQMNPTQKMRLAGRAGKQERQILLRDSSPQVAMALLANPHIEDKEVLEICKNTYAASGVLQRVAQDRRYSGNHEIQLALVRNPKTPTPLAMRLLELLRVNDLRDLAKSQNLRESVKKGALRIYLLRSK